MGVWNALRSSGMTFQAVSGTSVGALNGSLIVTDSFHQAQQIWLSMTYDRVMDVDPVFFESFSKRDFSNLTLKQTGSFLWETLKTRGFDITPLRRTIEQYVDEDAIRKSPIDFYIITCSLDDFTEKEIHAQELKDGELVDMLLASSYLPAFRNEKLGGKRYLDGGFMDLSPIHILVENHHKNIIEIGCNAAGFYRPVILPEDTHVYTITPTRSVGKTLEFSPAQSAQNLKTGYFDGLRFLNGLKGRLYYIDQQMDEQEAYALLLSLIRTYSKSSGQSYTWRTINEKVLPRLASRTKSGDADYYQLLLALMETAADEAGVDPFKIRTESELLDELFLHYPPADGRLPKALQSPLSKWLGGAL